MAENYTFVHLVKNLQDEIAQLHQDNASLAHLQGENFRLRRDNASLRLQIGDVESLYSSEKKARVEQNLEAISARNETLAQRNNAIEEKIAADARVAYLEARVVELEAALAEEHSDAVNLPEAAPVEEQGVGLKHTASVAF